ncbi:MULTISPECIES: hypothetical protein [Erysipelotrichales]|uniref:Uncharacterized protein n=1 Tax=Amedibacterium intestinale TaxID=2583452 RepID=A0A6N4TIL0_9FIRM|nr:hypothetical protein [Amedibacterium intestinale]RHO24554.1 hypothetical protein DW220_00105 [Eubacterium sp. AM18-26]RHO28871.1 hypothetical protein DW212_00650 [Eubacterium sp. AM18-10LB-B]BBK22688.1 hypothetical protein Aargi30884_15910 [Amedibacterium intestinale]
MIQKRDIQKEYVACGWGCKHFFGRYYFVQYYSPATKGIRSWIWVLRKDIGKNNMMYSDHRKEKWND